MKTIRFDRIHALAFSCGFLSLCVEIFWIRYVGFARQNDPYTFGFVLGAFLLGVALGAQYGKYLCEKSSDSLFLVKRSATWLFVAAIYVPLAAGIYAFNPYPAARDQVLFLLIAGSAFCFSVMFPIVHHLGVPQSGNDTGGIGKHFSGVYCANVAGATLGPLFVGYGLLSWLGTEQVLYAIAAITWLVALCYLYPLSRSTERFLAIVAWPIFLVVLISIAQHDWLIKSVNSRPDLPEIKIFESRQGIVTVHKQITGGDMVMGGNVYDGSTNLSLKVNSNGLDRPLLMMALQDQPKRILMVGLSIGSWLALVREFPGIEHIDVVEINPGYLRALQSYPLQKAALQDSRVKLHIHDARRWIKLNPNERYDAVFMNTTFHWRNNASLLLSKEFLELIQSRMNPSAVLAFNATGSLDALFTATKVFKHAYRYSNFVYAADWDFSSKKLEPSSIKKYREFTMRGQLVFDEETQITKFLNTPFVDVGFAARVAGRGAEVITDQNMINEFKFGRQ
jgi:spermidine synthase